MYRKVLFTASSFAHIRSFHLPYLKAFRNTGLTVHVACGGSLCELPDADRVVPLPFEKKILSLSNFKAMQQLKQLIAAEEYDLVITHTSLAAFFTRFALYGLKKPPHLIYMCHGYLFDDNSSPLRRGVLLTAERMVSARTDLLLNMNRYDYELAKKYRLCRQIVLIPGVGVDYARLDQSRCIERADLRRRLDIPQDAFVLFYAAEFSTRKNQALLIRAMSSLPKQVFLVLAGMGDCLDDCKKLAESLHVAHRIRFPGHVSPIADWYRMADAAVSSSRSEGLPFNIMEAMHFGLPILASDVKGNSDLIRNGETGILYPYNDLETYCAEVRRLFSSREECISLGSHAAVASKTCDLQAVFPVVWEHYMSMV